MSANLIWQIEITCDGCSMGPSIPATGWDVLSKLAAVKAECRKIGWDAEAYPDVLPH